jgi:hypothetical protein
MKLIHSVQNKEIQSIYNKQHIYMYNILSAERFPEHKRFSCVLINTDRTNQGTILSTVLIQSTRC